MKTTGSLISNDTYVLCLNGETNAILPRRQTQQFKQMLSARPKLSLVAEEEKPVKEEVKKDKVAELPDQEERMFVSG